MPDPVHVPFGAIFTKRATRCYWVDCDEAVVSVFVRPFSSPGPCAAVYGVCENHLRLTDETFTKAVLIRMGDDDA